MNDPQLLLPVRVLFNHYCSMWQYFLFASGNTSLGLPVFFCSASLAPNLEATTGSLNNPRL